MSSQQIKKYNNWSIIEIYKIVQNMNLHLFSKNALIFKFDRWPWHGLKLVPITSYGHMSDMIKIIFYYIDTGSLWPINRKQK